MPKITARILAIVIIAMVVAYIIIPFPIRFPIREKVTTKQKFVFQNEYGKTLVWDIDTISEVFDKKFKPASDSIHKYADSAYYYDKRDDKPGVKRCIKKANRYIAITDSLDKKYQFSELIRLNERKKSKSFNLLTI